VWPWNIWAVVPLLWDMNSVRRGYGCGRVMIAVSEGMVLIYFYFLGGFVYMYTIWYTCFLGQSGQLDVLTYGSLIRLYRR
jgi:hypothetical protein